MTMEQVRGRDRGGAANDTRYAIKGQSAPEFTLPKPEPFKSTEELRKEKAERAKRFLEAVERKVGGWTEPVTSVVRPLVKIQGMRESYLPYKELPLSTLTEQQITDRFEFLHENWAATDAVVNVKKATFRALNAGGAAAFGVSGAALATSVLTSGVGAATFTGTIVPLSIGVLAYFGAVRAGGWHFGKRFKRDKAAWAAEKAEIRAHPRTQSSNMILKLAALENPASQPSLNLIEQRLADKDKQIAAQNALINSLLASGTAEQLKRVPVPPAAAQTLAAQKPEKPSDLD